MKLIAIAALSLAFSAALAVADEPVSDEEGKKIQATLQKWGCKGGEMEKEPDHMHFEVDDVECSGGKHEYDFKLDSNFEVVLISRH